MSRIKIRVMGLVPDLYPIAEDFAADPRTVSVSSVYKNRPPSKEGRIYIEYDYPDYSPNVYAAYEKEKGLPPLNSLPAAED